MKKRSWMLLALVALSGCVTTTPKLPLPPPIPAVNEAEYDCVAPAAFDYVIRLRERVKTLEEIIRATH